MVENLPANAGDAGSSPGLGRSHMPRSRWAREPQLLSLSVWSLCSATREAAIVRGLRAAMKSGPRLPQLEKALAQKRRPNTAKNKLIKKGHQGTSLAVQRLRLCASSARGAGSIPGQGTKIPHAVRCSRKSILKKKTKTQAQIFQD